MTLEEFKTLPKDKQEEVYKVIKREKEEFNNKMTNRCQEDVRINRLLWEMMLGYLRTLYGNDEGVQRIINYMNFKMYILHKQDTHPLYVDIDKCRNNLKKLEEIISEKEQELNKIMPKLPIKVERSKPKTLFKKDGSLSVACKKWKRLTEGCGLDIEYEGKISEIIGYDEPNCQSSKQMKDFLFSIGWQPKIYRDGANGKVPQLRDDDKNLCPDIQRLIKEHPELESLDGLSVAQHRAGYLKGFLKHADSEGRVKAWAHGFTKTLRLKHSTPLVNLPKVSAQYGEYVRPCIVAPKGYKIVGSDLSSIEDTTKKIMLYPLDPEYVKSMNTKGWDAHLALGLTANMFTQEEVDFYKWYKNRDKEDSIYTCPDYYKDLAEEIKHGVFEQLDKRRAISKTANYALTYNAGVEKIMESTGLKRKEAQDLHKGYWDLNWAVKKYAETRIVKVVHGTNWVRMNKKVGGLTQVKKTNWIWNEFTGVWLYLKNDKDRFSAINQSNGVKVFDIWCMFLDKAGVNISGQFHDEWIACVKEDEVDEVIDYIKISMAKVNDYFKPPVPLECDYKVGSNYGDVH